ncbi:MAG: hypothetical protein ACRD8K_02740 [Nitrososphaeraceae archaeon]
MLCPNSVSKDIVKKVAKRTCTEANLGQVQEVSNEHIITEKGTI